MVEKKRQLNLKDFYILIGLTYLVLAVLVVTLMGSNTFQVGSNYWTANPLLSQTSTVFVTASHIFWNIQFRWLVLAMTITSLMVPLVRLLKLKGSHNLGKYILIDSAISGGIMIVIIALLTGVQDLATLILLVGTSTTFYFLMELKNTNKNLPKSISIHALRSVGLIWVLVLIYTIATFVYGMVRLPWFVYVTYLIGLLTYSHVICGSLYSRNKFPALIKNHPTLVNHALRLSFVLVLIIGLSR